MGDGYADTELLTVESSAANDKPSLSVSIGHRKQGSLLNAITCFRLRRVIDVVVLAPTIPVI